MRSSEFQNLFNRMMYIYDRSMYIDSLTAKLLKDYCIPYELWWFSQAFAKSFREAIDGTCNPLIVNEFEPVTMTMAHQPVSSLPSFSSSCLVSPYTMSTAGRLMVMMVLMAMLIRSPLP